MWNHQELVLLPATGQAASYRTGDDGHLKAGRPGGSRFRDMGNGTVYDHHTDLVWVRNPTIIIPGAVGVHASNQVQAARGNWANSMACAKADLAKDAADSTYWVCVAAHTSAASPATFAQDRAANPGNWRQSVWTASAANLATPALMDWNAAIDACWGLSYAGYDDWRLPNWLELGSLFDSSVSVVPPINAAMFPNTQTSGSGYWSSTTQADSTTWAIRELWQVGRPVVGNQAKTSTCYVRPVRGGKTNV